MNLEVSEYRYPRCQPGHYEGHASSVITIRRTEPGEDRWAVFVGGQCLIRHGKGTRWVIAPIPSERTESFIRRATFTLDEVEAVIEARLAVDAREHERWMRKRARRATGGGR